jgi:hypothetical protein
MAYARTAADPHSFVEARAPQKSGRSLLRRFYDALVESRQRAAEREIAVYLHDIGGKFTDDAEREIERRFLSSSTHW